MTKKQTTTTTKTVTRRVAGRAFSVDVPATHDDEYGLLVSAADLQRAELAIAAALALEGPVTGDGFRFLRGALGLPAKELAARLDVAPETISRWENGARPVDRAAWLVLGTLALERAGRPASTEERMRALVEGEKPPAERRVEIVAPLP